MNSMTPDEFKRAQRLLGMSDRDMADALLLSPQSGADTVRKMKRGTAAISGPVEAAVRLMLEREGLA